jgi:hypothetical protein
MPVARLRREGKFGGRSTAHPTPFGAWVAASRFSSHSAVALAPAAHLVWAPQTYDSRFGSARFGSHRALH